MKRRNLVLVAMMLVIVMSLSSCEFFDMVGDFFRETFGEEVKLEASELNAEKLVDFKDGEPSADVMFPSDGWSNGDVFNVVWKSNNVHYDNWTMRLGITEETVTSNGVEYPYSAGEARTANYYHYGDYEVCMKPSANPGTASTFFVCTGPYDVKDGVENPHDEIDIEFLGNDTTKVQFNFFVDGEPVYRVTTDDVKEAKNLAKVEKLPSTAGRILTNYWCGNERAWGWMGQYKGEVNDNGTTYQWIATSAEGAPLNPPTEEPPVDGGDPVDPSVPTKLDVEFKTDHSTFYTIEAPAQYSDSARITYQNVVGGDWANVNTWLDGKMAGYDTFSFKIRNDGEAEVNIWLQLQNSGANVKEEHLIIPAGEEKSFEISYSGNIQIALFFIDSSHVVEDDALYSGDITIFDIKVCKKGTDEPGTGDGPVTPPAASVPVQFEYWWASDTTLYTFEGNNPLTVTYNGPGSDYQCLGGHPSNYTAGQNTFAVTITNNGEVASNIRVDIKNSNDVACNISATAEGYSVEMAEGAVIEVPAGESATLVITFDPTDCPISNIVFFVDTTREDADTTYNSNITLSDMSFSTVGGGSDEPVEPQPTLTYSPLFVEFKTTDAYTLTLDGENPINPENPYINSVNVAYDSIIGGKWSNVNVWLEDKWAPHSVFTGKIKNNGTEGEVVVFVKVQDPDGGELGVKEVTIAAGAEETFTIAYEGHAKMLFFFIDSTKGTEDDIFSGNITISDVQLGQLTE